MEKQLNNFLLKGGRLLDPAHDKDGKFDVLVKNGLIESIAPNLDSVEIFIRRS